MKLGLGLSPCIPQATTAAPPTGPYASDTFDRANSLTLGNTDGGYGGQQQSWAWTTSGGMQIVSNRVVADQDNSYAYIELGVSDLLTVSCDLQGTASVGHINGVFLNYDYDINNKAVAACLFGEYTYESEGLQTQPAVFGIYRFDGGNASSSFNTMLLDNLTIGINEPWRLSLTINGSYVSATLTDSMLNQDAIDFDLTGSEEYFAGSNVGLVVNAGYGDPVDYGGLMDNFLVVAYSPEA